MERSKEKQKGRETKRGERKSLYCRSSVESVLLATLLQLISDKYRRETVVFFRVSSKVRRRPFPFILARKKVENILLSLIRI